MGQQQSVVLEDLRVTDRHELHGGGGAADGGVVGESTDHHAEQTCR